MKSFSIASLSFILLAVPVMAANGNPEAEGAGFRAGAATADLTPPDGVKFHTLFSAQKPVLGVHDPLHARAVALSLGETNILIVVNDLSVIDRKVYDRAKQIVHQRTGIPVENQLMCTTHTHAAPRLRRTGTPPGNEDYRSLVAERIAEAGIQAHRNLAPAKVGFATFSKPELVACRRYFCKKGTVTANPYGETDERVKSVAGRSSAVIRPAGPADPEFSILSIQHADGRPLALLGNFSVHYCGGHEQGLVSADYFGVYARRLEERLSSGDPSAPFVGILSNGTSGDTDPLISTAGRRAGPWTDMKYFGTLLADETLALIEGIEHHAPRSLTMVSSELKLRVRKPDEQRLAWAKKLLADPEKKGSHRWSREYAEEALYLSEYPEWYTLPLQAIRIGEIGIAAAPCEAFAETGLAIKDASPLRHTMTINQANDGGGYLPTPQQHEWGGYETWEARTSFLGVGAEPKIRAELIRLLNATLTQDEPREE